VDLLQPLLAAAVEVEQLGLQQAAAAVAAAAAGAGGTLAAVQGQVEAAGKLLQQLQRMQAALGRLFELVHVPLQHQFDVCGLGASGSPPQLQEHLPWCWLQLHKHLQRLLDLLRPDSALTQLRASWQYMAQQMAEALQLTQHVDKPLLWRHAGHPLLPSSRRLAAAQQQGAALAAALSVVTPPGLASRSASKVFAVDGTGQAVGLAAAGVDVAQLIGDALRQFEMARAGADSTDEGMAGVGVGEEVGPEVREQLAAAVAAGVACCPVLHAACVQGLALLHTAALPQAAALCSGSSSSNNVKQDARQPSVDDAVQVPVLLQQQVALRAQQLATGAVKQYCTHQQQQAGADAGSSTAVAAALSRGMCLPGAAMATEGCRTLQLNLMQLYGSSLVNLDFDLLTQLFGWAVAAATGSASSSSSVGRLQGLLQELVEVSSSQCVRDPQGLLSHQQLVWVLGSFQQAAAAAEVQGGGAASNQQLSEMQQQLLPSLLHAAWYAWQQAAWASGSSLAALVNSSSSTGADLVKSRSKRGLQVDWELLHGPAQRHLATQTAAVQQLVGFGSGDVTTQRQRVTQLRLALQHLLSVGAVATSSSSSSSGSGWGMLGMQLAVVLLAHTSSLPEEASRSQLQQLVQQLLLEQPHGSEQQQQQQPGWLQPRLQQLGQLLGSSSHSLLRSLAPQLLSCVEATAAALHNTTSTSSTTSSSSKHSSRAAGGGWQQGLAAEGHAWVLLGCVRLQLGVPPAGVDPAGKAALAAAATGAALQQVDAELQVRNTLLPFAGCAPW
jgi:midasin